MLLAGSSPLRACSVPRVSCSALTRSWTARWGSLVAWAAAMARARGRRAHRVMSSWTASGSAVTRLAPRRVTRSWRASSVVSRSRVSGWAPSMAIRPVSRLRLVTRMRQPGEQGPHLGGIAGIVEHDEDAFVGEHAAVEVDLGVGVGRDALDGDA